jgi:nitrate/TMAO reductase-like tetraheme cytochrome c subunit
MNEKPRGIVWNILTLHWLSLLGSALVTTAVISLLFVLPLQFRGHVENPYAGIVFFLILPAIFFAGLALIPIGLYLGKRRHKGLGETPLDRKAALRRLAWFFGVTTILNIVIGTQVTYRAVEHMETQQFCGQTCHVMHPQYAAYQNSPHSRVECVGCHVAPGASGWLASKTAGTRQLIEMVRGNYSRPIPGALESGRLVSASGTCENCHWAQRFGSVRLRVITSYAEDEKNSRTQTVLMMMVGGSRFKGIHGSHFGPGIQIRYAPSDPTRQTIPWVEYQNTTTGVDRVFASSDSAPDASKNLPKYEMQCVDCHNRPAHTFESASRGMDDAMALGDISVSLPFIKKKGVEVLKAGYSSSQEASEKIPAALVSYYQQTYPEVYANQSQNVQSAAQAVLAIYNRNVFPNMKVDWGTYPNNLGHVDFPGCFRCHDGGHTAASGETITQDCNACHEPLAMDEASPQILKTLGIEERIANLQKK